MILHTDKGLLEIAIYIDLGETNIRRYINRLF